MARVDGWMVGVGAARAATGLWFLAAPERPARAWVGQTDEASTYLTRVVGGRDFVIGAGLLASAVTGRSSFPWVLASAGADLTDALAGAAMLGGTQRRNAIGFAGGFIVFTAAALGARALRRR